MFRFFKKDSRLIKSSVIYKSKSTPTLKVISILCLFSYNCSIMKYASCTAVITLI